MKISQIAIAVIVVIGSYVVMSSIYTVNEVEQMIITQFGKPVGDPVTSCTKGTLNFRPAVVTGSPTGLPNWVIIICSTSFTV